ncbi:MAG: C4-dicarboxylate ABC transporter permease [SAR116 cluster bacterium]|nr:C4-dicarboxylate ABC transporter permease [SAR116 cluster bacterium]MBU96305.1 C4-dicarboxylate ABC transporter permease [Rhodospirillaceae bacterium]
MFGIDGVLLALIITFIILFGAILSGFPVAFAIGGAGVLSFSVVALLDSSGLLTHTIVDVTSPEYKALLLDGISRLEISKFSYPDLPRITEPVFPGGWEQAVNRTLSFVVNRVNERVIAGQSIETLLAILMFVLMGITLEKSNIANDLLTSMARVFGGLPGGLAVSVVVVGAFLAASTGIVGATVVTMGLLSLPTMLRNNYSPQLATGVISASGTLGQIIPPSIVIIILGTLAGEIYSTAQEERARSVGCNDALTYLGEPAVISVGTLFQAALLPGIMLALLYALYAFGYALFRPESAPAVPMGDSAESRTNKRNILIFVAGVPAALAAAFLIMQQTNMVGSQDVTVDSYSDIGITASLRTNVSEECQASMIALHGQDAWDQAISEAEAIAAKGGVEASKKLTEEEMAAVLDEKLAIAAPIGFGIGGFALVVAILISFARGSDTGLSQRHMAVGFAGAFLSLVVDTLLVTPLTTPGMTIVYMLIPWAMVYWGIKPAIVALTRIELLRVVFPPLVLIVAVLGSILGGITNPTPAAGLGASGALMLAAFRKLNDEQKSTKLILQASYAVVICILMGVNFDLRMNVEGVDAERWIAFLLAYGAYLYALFGLLYACFILYRGDVLAPVVRETSKVTSMVFTILIGSQVLNLVVISYGGEHYIQQYLRSFDNEVTIFLIVMLLLFLLGFVLDFLEIIYIVVPIVGPVIYGGTFDPAWVTIMIAINLQTSFLTPPFGFALFYLRGVAPKSVLTTDIYRGVIPFVAIQIVGLLILWFFPGIVTIVPQLLGG